MYAFDTTTVRRDYGRRIKPTDGHLSLRWTKDSRDERYSLLWRVDASRAMNRIPVGNAGAALTLWCWSDRGGWTVNERLTVCSGVLCDCTAACIMRGWSGWIFMSQRVEHSMCSQGLTGLPKIVLPAAVLDFLTTPAVSRQLCLVRRSPLLAVITSNVIFQRMPTWHSRQEKKTEHRLHKIRNTHVQDLVEQAPTRPRAIFKEISRFKLVFTGFTRIQWKHLHGDRVPNNHLPRLFACLLTPERQHVSAGW